MVTTDEAKRLSEQYKSHSDEQLCTLMANRTPGSIEAILASGELAQRYAQREREEQHKLDLELLAQQIKWMKFSALTGIGETILGVLLGAWLQSGEPGSAGPATPQKTEAQLLAEEEEKFEPTRATTRQQ